MKTPLEAIKLALGVVAVSFTMTLVAMKLSLAIAIVSVTMTLVVAHCSKSETKDNRTEVPSKPTPPPKPEPTPPEPIQDVPVLDYLETQKPDVGGRWKIIHKRVIEEELYTLVEMPFKDGLVKFDASGRSCLTFPVAYWQKITEDARCVVTIHFDCNGNERRHTSECIVL